jgi:hypothetical protein
MTRAFEISRTDQSRSSVSGIELRSAGTRFLCLAVVIRRLIGIRRLVAVEVNEHSHAPHDDCADGVANCDVASERIEQHQDEHGSDHSLTPAEVKRPLRSWSRRGVHRG